MLFSFNNPGNCIFSISFLNQFSSVEHIKLKVLRYKLELMKCLIKHSKCRIVNIYCLSHFLVPSTSSFHQGCAHKNIFNLSFLFVLVSSAWRFECLLNILIFLVCKFPASFKTILKKMYLHVAHKFMKKGQLAGD